MIKARKEHLNCLGTSDSLQLISMPKSYDKDINWNKANNANYITSNFTPYDSSDELKGTIPGVTVQIDYKKPIRIKTSNKTVITLFKIKSGIKLRAYQVEACDEKKVSSHDGVNNINGCHEHIGKETNKISPLYKVEDISSWFYFFCDKVYLDFTGKINSITDE